MFSEKREKLVKKLEVIRQQIKQVEKQVKSRKIKRSEASKAISEFNLQREIIEQELLELIVETEDSFQQEAWVGFKKGLLGGLKSLEKLVDNSLAYQKNDNTITMKEDSNKKKSIFNSMYAKIAEKPVLGWITTAFLVYFLLISVDCLAGGFKMVSGGADGVKQLFEFANNPFSGLLVGMLATALIQSSSTTTSIIVGLCAAGLPVPAAIPMVMGANIGTSVTNTLVSLGHIGNKDEFRRAFAAATVHDFFNLLAVVIFLPLELCFGVLEKSSHVIASALTGGTVFDVEKYNLIKIITKPVCSAIASFFKGISDSQYLNGGLFIVFGLILIFFAILSLGKVLRLMLIGKAEKLFNRAVGHNAVTGIGTGCLITVLVQSSSTTTSLIVPLAGAGVMTLPKVYPFTLGANIGTCITAILAALAVQSGAEFGLQIAFVHLLFNVFAVILIYSVPLLRNIPIRCAQALAGIATKKKIWAIGYVIGVFFVLPVCFIAISEIITAERDVYICSECQRKFDKTGKEIIENIENNVEQK